MRVRSVSTKRRTLSRFTRNTRVEFFGSFPGPSLIADHLVELLGIDPGGAAVPCTDLTMRNDCR
jgi:hypothetical protein